MAKLEDLVGIFNNDTFEQLFINAKPIKVSVNDNSQVMSHPVEDGSKVSDHQVFDLIAISMPVILSENDFISVYQNIDKAYRSGTLFTIQTKVNVYKDMVISSKPHDETVDGGIALNLSFTQFKSSKTIISYAPQFAKDSNTQQNGVQSGKAVSDDKAKSLLKGLLQ